MIPALTIIAYILICIFRYGFVTLDLLIITWVIFLPKSKNDYSAYHRLLLATAGTYSLIWGSPVGLLLFCTAIVLLISTGILNIPTLQTLRATITWIVIIFTISLAERVLILFFTSGLLIPGPGDISRLFISILVGFTLHSLIQSRKRL